MSVITYRGKSYPIRAITVKAGRKTIDLMIGSESLNKVLMVGGGYRDNTAEAIDINIFYYVSDYAIKLPAGKWREYCQRNIDFGDMRIK